MTLHIYGHNTIAIL